MLKTPVNVGAFVSSIPKWNRRESNPGPNKQSKSFLHAYSPIGFSLPCEAGNSHMALSSSYLNSSAERKTVQVYFYGSP